MQLSIFSVHIFFIFGRYNTMTMRFLTNRSADTPAENRSPENGSPQLLPRLTPDLERGFQADYYSRIRPTLRVMAPLFAALFAACTVRDYADTGSLGVAAAQDGIPAAFFLAAFALSWVPAFGRVWQPVLAAASLAIAVASLGAMAAFLAVSGAGHGGGMSHEPASARGASPAAGQFLGQQVCLLMVCLASLRLRFRWAVPLQLGVFGTGVWAFVARLNTAPVTAMDLSHFLRPAAGILSAVLLAALAGEQQALRAFVAERLLEEERNGERRRREQTQGQLRVLAQAIGGIVHDLGNPLTVVQMGADLVEMQADSGDAAAIRETNGAVRDGAQMLAALRLSLIEQTRVLEGKAIPVNLWAEPLRPIVEAGTRFQNPRFASGRRISVVGEDLEVYADRPKLITVFMNLIGNALKYSDGEVSIVWRVEGDAVLVGVLDQGTSGRGISEAQARQLFVAFGRLETHAAVEGTGLGLVSALKIVEAHGGEVFVEGHADGTPDAPSFTTAQGRYPSLLADGFRTGFVVACPMPPVENFDEGEKTFQERDEKEMRSRDHAETR